MWSHSNYTFSQSGLPACVFVLKPVMRSLFCFLWIKSSAIWRPMALTSVFLRAEVMYMCMSRNLSKPPCSLCSISNWFNRLTNHSNERWSRFIQKKSTFEWSKQWIWHGIPWIISQICVALVLLNNCMSQTARGALHEYMHVQQDVLPFWVSWLMKESPLSNRGYTLDTLDVRCGIYYISCSQLL